ncbi:hypothetical protein [Demequina sp.]|uniref:hypothetical protein n=1 Tax=Demequina sp. TaxID=2050685 RepID=UPI003D0D6D23
MNLGGSVSPSPSPTYSNDPFNPDVTIWPEAPDWLFPAVMIATGVVVAVVIVLIVMWRKSVIAERQAKEAKGPTEWVDLSKLDKKGRWAEDDEK